MAEKEVRLIDANAIDFGFPMSDDLNGMLMQIGIEMAKTRVDNAHTIDPESLRQQWRDAKTDPPNKPGEYIVMIEDAKKSTTLWYSGRDWADISAYKVTYYDVTHWMPLPEPPKEA